MALSEADSLFYGAEYVGPVFDYLQTPVELEGELLFFGHLPVDIQLAHTLGDAEQAEGCANANIEALGKSIHGYLDISVCVVDSLLGESGELGAENQACGLGDVELAYHRVVLVRGSGYYLIAFLAKCIVGIEGLLVFVYVHPFVGSHCYFAVGTELVVLLDDVHILDSETIATAQYGACIMTLIDVFNHNAYVACAVLYQRIEQVPFVFGIQVGKGFVELYFLLKGITIKEMCVVLVDFGHSYCWV